jgi:dienelactone hydrolase
MVVSDQASPRFSDNGLRLYLGTAPPPTPPRPEDAPPPTSVDIWNWRDPLLQPMQRVRATQERNRNYRAVVHLADKRFVQLATTDFPTVNPGDDANRAIGSSDLPYQKEISWDATYNDIALVDLNTGQRQKVMEHWRGAPTMSPGGKYLLYFDDSNGNWFTHRIADGARVNLTEKLGVNFCREDHDTPNVPPPYGSAGWTADDRSVLLYDKYDVWEIRPDGTGARMITGGEGRAILTKPDNFDPAKKYPLMVYIYEELSEGLYTYRPPAPGTSINITRYVSNGYVVLQPDIIYETGYPGESAQKCVIPAVQQVVDKGFIDPKRIGIQGHSGGGFQITHLITRTNMFAAVEAGASVSNMISAYGGIRWGTGMSRAFQYEKTQSRIGRPPWDAPLQFIENSPIFWVEKVHTPYLTIHNDEDDAVPWYQGIEFFSAMRRLGKEAYMFVYNGEPHGLRQRDNQKHWTVHMDEFFDHFLLGKPMPDWMTKGVPFLEKGKRDVSDLFKRKAAVTTTSQDK